MVGVFIHLPAALAIIISAFAVLGAVLLLKLIYDIYRNKNASSERIDIVTPINDEEEIVAVITAAIAAYLDKPSDSIRITSVRKSKGASNPWRNAGIREIMN